MKILILGAGYVGMALLKQLQDLPHEVWVSTTDASRIVELGQYSNRVLVITPDDNTSLKEAIVACDAMIVLVAPKNSATYESTYLNTAKRICSSLKGRKTPFYLLYTSSTSVCENFQNEWVSEDTPLYPTSANAKTLLATEQCYLNSGVSTCILRLGGIYGPERDLADRAKRISGKTMPGTGLESTNHIHQEDIVRAIIFCLEHQLTGLYHLVNNAHPSKKELYVQLCDAAQLPPPFWDLSQPLGSYKITNAKIKQAGFIFQHPNLNP